MSAARGNGVVAFSGVIDQCALERVTERRFDKQFITMQYVDKAL